jgi:flagellar basal body rod protein FlgB
MSDRGIDAIEAGMRFARARAAVLADDVANARTPGFVPHDAGLVDSEEPSRGPFAAVLQEVQARGAAGVLEFAMGAQARNAVTYRALADQEHAMLKELRTVAEEARR